MVILILILILEASANSGVSVFGTFPGREGIERGYFGNHLGATSVEIDAKTGVEQILKNDDKLIQRSWNNCETPKNFRTCEALFFA